MPEPNSSDWYQYLVEQLSRGALTAVRVATFSAWEVTILVEEDDPETLARTERLLEPFVTALAPVGTQARVLSLKAFARAARPLRSAVVEQD